MCIRDSNYHNNYHRYNYRYHYYYHYNYSNRYELYSIYIRRVPSPYYNTQLAKSLSERVQQVHTHPPVFTDFLGAQFPLQCNRILGGPISNHSRAANFGINSQKFERGRGFLHLKYST